MKTLNFRKNSKLTTFSFENIDLTVFKLFQRLTVPQKVDQFGRKGCQTKRKDVSYELLSEFFQKYFVVNERSAYKNWLSTYVLG